MARIRGNKKSNKLVGTKSGDQIIGMGGNDKLIGRSGDDTLLGGDGNDKISGGGGNDEMTGGTGNDFISGGLGSDTATYSGNIGEYDFAVASATTIGVSHARGLKVDGVDTIDNTVEFLKFADTGPISIKSSAPTAFADSLTVTEGSSKDGTSVLANDFDLQAKLGTETLTVSEVNGQALSGGSKTITLVSGAEVTMNADGTYTYDTKNAWASLDTGENGSDSFTYQVSDGQGGFSTGTVSINVEGKNDAPTVVTEATSVLNVLNLLTTILSPNIEISDVDDTVLTGAEVVITKGFQLGDQLLFTAQSGITGVFDAVTQTLSLVGEASVEDYETALESIMFSVSGVLALGDREITVSVNDGEAMSLPTASATIDLEVIL